MGLGPDLGADLDPDLGPDLDPDLGQWQWIILIL